MTNLSWISSNPDYINQMIRNTQVTLSNNYNDLDNIPIIKITSTTNNPQKIWELKEGLYMINGVVQVDNSTSYEVSNLLISMTARLENGKYILSAFIPYLRGLFEYILKTNSTEYEQHQKIVLMIKNDTLTLDNETIYTPIEDYHPATKKYVDDKVNEIVAELDRMGVNKENLESLNKENRIRDIKLQALLSETSDRNITIEENVRYFDMPLSIDNGIVTINEIVGETLVNVCDQEESVAITKSYTVENENHIALQGEYDGKCRPVIQGNTLVNLVKNGNVKKQVLVSNATLAKYSYSYKLKESTDYTIVFNLEGLNSSVAEKFMVSINKGVHGKVYPLVNGLNIIKYNSDTMTNTNEIWFYIQVGQTLSGTEDIFVSDVMIFEGDLTQTTELIPTEYVEGLKSSFEDGYIIGENLAIDTTEKTLVSTGERFYHTQTNIIKDTVYTVYCKLSNIINVSEFKAVYLVNGAEKTVLLKSNISKDNNIVFKSFVANGNSDLRLYIDINTGQLDVSDLVILEGDHTHLSEAELMRYIEKGTSHYEEEDYNHVGKYKVEYKVTGKNKFNVNSLTSTSNNFIVLGDKISINTPSQYCQMLSEKLDLIPGNQYVLQGNITPGSEVSIRNSDDIAIAYLGDNVDSNNHQSYKFIATEGCYFRCSNRTLVSTDVIFSNIQIEEGTVSTPYEPYKEFTKTFYLNSPLLEGDTIEDVNGKATHVKRYGKVVLDGSEDWRVYEIFTNEYSKENLTTFCIDTFIQNDNGWSKTICYCDKFDTVVSMNDPYWRVQECLGIGNKQILVCTYKAKTLNEFKQWLQNNPTTVVYQLASPIYEPISDESILCDSYVNGHLDFDSAVPVEKVQFRALGGVPLRYVQTNKTYIVQFEADNIGKASIFINGEWNGKYTNVVKGINKIEIPITLEITQKVLWFSGIGFNASNIQVVEANEDIEFGYFKGLQSSFENGLVTDENDENYGKYKVEVKIVGKNKFDINKIEYGKYQNSSQWNYDITSNVAHAIIRIKVKPNTIYCISDKGVKRNVSGVYYHEDTPLNWFNTAYVSNITTPNNCDNIVLNLTDYNTYNISDIQLEEGTHTPYVPYKESIHTLYLNSPLLKGDKLVVHDGKLCHYHKMGMIVFDGSKDINILDNSNTNTSICSFKLDKIAPSYSIAFCDNFIWIYKYNEDCKHFYVSSDNVLFTLEKTKLSSLTVDGWKQWFEQNPTTVVYELETPYYEPIEPQISQYSFSTVKDGDMEIITVLPIEKINLTYRTDINGVSSIEEQIASIQEGTDISSIIDEEVDE